MSDDDATPEGPALDGLPLEAAVETVVERTGDDPDAVEATLREVTAEGVVCHDAAESALAHASKTVATPETRVEHAAMRVADARDAADAVAHLDPVGARLEDLDARLGDVESRVADLGADLRSLVDRADDLYAVATGIRRLTTAAHAAQRTADELAADAEEFAAWVRRPDRRLDDLAEEADAVASSLDDLAAAVDGPDDAAPSLHPALRHRVLRLLLADIRVEVDAFRTWPDPAPDADHGAVDPDRLADLTDSLDVLDGRCRAVGARLDAPDDARLDALDDLEPPVDWGRVEAVVEGRRPG